MKKFINLVLIKTTKNSLTIFIQTNVELCSKEIRCESTLKREFFFNNVNSGTNFWMLKETMTKNCWNMNLLLPKNYEFFVSGYLVAIQKYNDKYDMLTNKSSKLLFYNFKNYLNRRGQTRTKSNTYNYI